MPIAYLLSHRTLQALRRYDFYSQAITTGMKPTAVSYPIRVRLEGTETFHWCDSYSPFAPEARISNFFSNNNNTDHESAIQNIIIICFWYSLKIHKATLELLFRIVV